MSLMRRSGLAGLVSLVLIFSVSTFGQTGSGLKVDESQIKFRLDEHPVLVLPVVNNSGKPLDGAFRLELLDTNGKVVSSVTGTFEEKPGTTVEKIAWPVDYLATISPPSLGWHRLRYEFVLPAKLGVSAAEGIVQLSRVLVGGFETRLSADGIARPGNKYPVRVRVDDPVTGKAIHGIPVELTLEIGDDDDNAVKHTVTTNYTGYAVYSFDLPKDVLASEGKVTAEAKRGPFSDDAEITFQFPAKNKLTLTTDKPLYQPGQTAHMRILALGPDRKALANKDVEVAIKDEEGNEQFHETLKTSRFGVATADWQIPEKLRLGDYNAGAKVKGSNDDDDYGQPEARATLRVSRYELPTFTVKADPDRTYYLPGQDAKIVISADYLFGKPVTSGKVRLVKQENRHWDFKEQKWTADESDPIEGELDKNGKFEAKLDLQDDFKGFDPQNYSHFEDMTLAAYVTDASTKRTEQRRFRIRLSEKPIQLYVVEGDRFPDPGKKGTLYVTSSYADGTPASVNGVMYFAEPTNVADFEKDLWQGGRTKVLTFHTNRYGVAKITVPRIRDKFLVTPRYQYQYDSYYYSGARRQLTQEAMLLFEAEDNKGLAGRGSENWIVGGKHSYLRVNTTQTLYHTGDAVPVTIESNANREVIVNVSTETGLITSRVVQLVNGHAEVTVDYDQRFRGEVEIAAFALTKDEDDNYALEGATHVIYPALDDLTVAVKMAQTTYRPGEKASADFKVRSAEGDPVESALGVLVFDRAVAERVRSDEEFGREYGFSIYDYLDDTNFGRIAGIGYRDLLSLNPNQPFSPDLQLLAEVLMTAGGGWLSGGVQMQGGEDYVRNAGSVFALAMNKSLQPVRLALDNAYDRDRRYPKDDAELNAILADASVDLVQIRDPWGMPYRTEYSVRGAYDELTFESDGPDKKAGTADDAIATSVSRAYFRRVGEMIDRVAREYPHQTGKYIRDYAALRAAMKAKDVDTDALRDPWGRQYKFTFDISGPYFRIAVSSAGPDGAFDTEKAPSWDDVQEWTSQTRYFIAESEALERALTENFAKTKSFPQNEEELKPILAAAGLSGERLLDPWGRPYHFTFSKRSRYWDRLNISTYYDYTAAQQKRTTEVVPVTQEMAFLTVSSYGPENKQEQAFSVAEFSRVLAEQSSKELEKKSNTVQGPLPSGSGAIAGVVTDQTGAVVPNATVIAISQSSREETVTTGPDGRYVIASLSVETYELRVNAAGFSQSIVTRVPVQMGSTTTVDVRLNVGSMSQMVEVTAGVAQVSTEAAMLASVVPKGLQGGTLAEKSLFTPRLRKYFPETLVWKPEVITDKRGQAHIEFAMADNITAWSMSVIASTEAGKFGVAKKELRTFQPFFVEHDPPKVLTEGDQVSLPVVLRNYSDKQQTLETEMKTESWFSLLSPAQQKVTVEAGGNANAVFTFKATARANPGTQRVTARNAETGDAVQREVRVHPDGQEISFTTGRVLAGENNALELTVPQAAIAGSIDGELRIYPNVIAHVLDAMDGIAKKPAGCAEQITSVAYVNLQALQLLKKAGVTEADANDPRAKIMAGARKSVEQGYEMLPSLQQQSGGFGYWRESSANTALTAYVLRFLVDASEFVEVDPDVIQKGRQYLIKEQSASGAWTTYDWLARAERDNAMETAYVVRALAETKSSVAEKDRAAVDKAIEKALTYLDDRISEWRDPYLVGNYAIAAAALKHPGHIENARELLAKEAHKEGTTTYWNLEANTTPFYGWGWGGRLETTALAVEALAKMEEQKSDPAVEEQVNRGLQFLLTHKDRYAMWYSTQATQNVLEALIEAMPVGKGGSGDNTATVMVNGMKVAEVKLPAATEVVGPRVVEFGKELKAGNNTVSVARAGDSGAMQGSVITGYYVPWTKSAGTQTENFQSGDTRALKLTVEFDKEQAKIGDPIGCKVGAERIGFAGYGMMMAEIGLPPGAEVDRESLEKAKNDGQVNGYEVQPDRVVFYLWPSAGGTSFQFSFRTRFGINALSAPSILYDYYNPEANAVVTPVKFSIR